MKGRGIPIKYLEHHYIAEQNQFIYLTKAGDEYK